jgi:hypothetical protein
MDRVKDQVTPGGAAAWTAPTQAMPSGGCPDPSSHFQTEVNKGSIRMQTWQSHINGMYAKGYRLAHVFEQDGNTVQVFEHHLHA